MPVPPWKYSLFRIRIFSLLRYTISCWQSLLSHPVTRQGMWNSSVPVFSRERIQLRNPIELKPQRDFYLAKWKESTLQKQRSGLIPRAGSHSMGSTLCVFYGGLSGSLPPILPVSHHPLDLRLFLPFSLFAQVWTPWAPTETHGGGKATV